MRALGEGLFLVQFPESGFLRFLFCLKLGDFSAKTLNLCLQVLRFYSVFRLSHFGILERKIPQLHQIIYREKWRFCSLFVRFVILPRRIYLLLPNIVEEWGSIEKP